MADSMRQEMDWVLQPLNDPALAGTYVVREKFGAMKVVATVWSLSMGNVVLAAREDQLRVQAFESQVAEIAEAMK